jgi:hypothetical protein
MVISLTKVDLLPYDFVNTIRYCTVPRPKVHFFRREDFQATPPQASRTAVTSSQSTQVLYIIMRVVPSSKPFCILKPPEP